MLSAIEKETIINFNESEKTASVYTFNSKLMRQLATLYQERPNEVILNRDEGDCVEYTIPKSWVKIRASRILTDEQRAAMGERMRQNLQQP